MPDRLSLGAMLTLRQIPWRVFNSFPERRRERVDYQPALLIISLRI